MLLALLALQIVLLLAVLALYTRKPQASETTQDPRHAAIPDQLTNLHARHEALDLNLRAGLNDLRHAHGTEALTTRESNTRAFADLRTELTTNLDRFREDNATSAAALRTEVLGSLATLGNTLKSELATFRQDNASAATKLNADVHTHHEAINHRLVTANSESRQEHAAAREALHLRLNELSGTVQQRLDVLNTTNAAKLEEMRLTVDEKLNATLHTRLTESFGQVTDQLNKVHTGLGEMSKLSEGVDDLSRIFTNVKSRGGFAEVQLGMLLEQMLAPSQFLRNAKVKPNTLEVVEYAVRFPGHSGETLLPIDAKFPREDWERLENAYTANDLDLLAAAGKAFEAAIRTEGKRICEKYINPPTTTPHAIMFLPTEGLYAEVMRRDSLQAEVQSKCQVTIAGPSTLSAILTSFQMGFHMLALQEKGDEVWKVLESAKTEFGKFGKLMEKVEGDVGKIQKTLGEVGVRTRAINRTLREVSDTSAPLEFEDLARGTLQLAAVSDDD
jgi:DNA recombination protein RmuC